MGKPSLTLFFMAIAFVLVGGFAWLEFHQHAKALPALAKSSDAWQPPKSNPKAEINVKPPTQRSTNKKVSMGNGSSGNGSKRLSLKDAMAKNAAKEAAKRSADRDDSPPERNYDDIPASGESSETTFATDSSDELNDEAVEATPEELIMKGFGGNDPTKLSDELQEEFDELSKDGSDSKDSSAEETGDAKDRAKPQGSAVEPGEDPDEVSTGNGQKPSSDQTKIPIPQGGNSPNETSAETSAETNAETSAEPPVEPEAENEGQSGEEEE